MMKMVFAATLMGLALSACASAGTNYDQNAVYRLQPGDDIRSVVAALGRPNVESVDDKGNTVLVWVHSTASVLGAEARSVRLTFDPNGRLVAVPRQSALANLDAERDQAASRPASPSSPVQSATFSEGTTAGLHGRPETVLSKARNVLAAEGFAPSTDSGSSSLTTAARSYVLKPEHADCGRSFGIPYLSDRRAKSNVAYRVTAAEGTLRVQVALGSIYEAGSGAPNKVLSCTSTGALERALIARLTQ